MLVHFSPMKSSGRLAHDIRYTHFRQTGQPYSLHNYYVSETWSKRFIHLCTHVSIEEWFKECRCSCGWRMSQSKIQLQKDYSTKIAMCWSVYRFLELCYNYVRQNYASYGCKKGDADFLQSTLNMYLMDIRRAQSTLNMYLMDIRRAAANPQYVSYGYKKGRAQSTLNMYLMDIRREGLSQPSICILWI